MYKIKIENTALTELLMKEAMEFHIEGMLDEGLEIPKPSSREAEFVKISIKRKHKNESAMA